MGGLLYTGASWQVFQWYTDAAKYQCYAFAFWWGTPALRALDGRQCYFFLHPQHATIVITNAAIVQAMRAERLPAGLIQFVLSQSPLQPLHTLPYEYPLLVLLPFSLGLTAPIAWYQVAFACWMALCAGVLYVVLKRFKSPLAAIAFALYMVTGCWSTEAGRFDILPAGLTLIALLCAERRRWEWSFALLALATLLKFYPVVLVPPFFIAQQTQRQDAWFSPKRWSALGVFVAVCIVVVGLSLTLSVAGTLAPLGYFGSRPIQVESVSASILWVASFFGYHLHHEFTFGSLNVTSAISPLVASGGTVLLALGLVYIFWLQIRRKLSLAQAILLTLLVVACTGKVFSPQYLIWIAPFVAYIGECDRKWLIGWIGLGLLTTLIYPYIYTMGSGGLMAVPSLPLFYPVVFVRNVLLLLFLFSVLWQAVRARATATPA
jgi:hypothetical protein